MPPKRHRPVHPPQGKPNSVNTGTFTPIVILLRGAALNNNNNNNQLSSTDFSLLHQCILSIFDNPTLSSSSTTNNDDDVHFQIYFDIIDENGKTWLLQMDSSTRPPRTITRFYGLISNAIQAQVADNREALKKEKSRNKKKGRGIGGEDDGPSDHESEDNEAAAQKLLKVSTFSSYTSLVAASQYVYFISNDDDVTMIDSVCQPPEFASHVLQLQREKFASILIVIPVPEGIEKQ
eukprot:PhF_6_TR43537/c0_g1_i2/m.66839